MERRETTESVRRASRRRLALMAVIAAAVLLVPLVAMQVTQEVRWSPADFVAAAALMAIAGAGWELASRGATNPAYRAGVAVALTAGVALVWANGAVGIVGSAGSPVNLLFPLVPAVALLGALIVRFRARGMARVLVLTASAQLGAAAIALAGGWAAWTPDLAAATSVFAALWLAAAALFHKAAQR